MIRHPRLRVVHVAEDVSPIAGGVPAVVRQLSDRLAQQGVEVAVAHATACPGELPPGTVGIAFPPSRFGTSWRWGRKLGRDMPQLAAAEDGSRPVFHIHGVWAAPQYFAARAAYAAGAPFLLTAHGMLEPWLWNEQGWRIRTKKRIYWNALAYPAMSRASVIHAITPLEREHLSALFPGCRIEVIPNAVELCDAEEIRADERFKRILFLGRIEPKKGVDLLLRAFALARISSDWEMDVVGPIWSAAYSAKLIELVDALGLGSRVHFHGPLFGEAKLKAIDSAWVMAVPSYSEVVGLVNLEAAARFLPTITTHATGLHDWESGGGLLIDPDEESLRCALEHACSWSADEQLDRGNASRRLVEERYSWDAVLPQWIQLYSSL